MRCIALDALRRPPRATSTAAKEAPAHETRTTPLPASAARAASVEQR
jgi:hypothetical protein